MSKAYTEYKGMVVIPTVRSGKRLVPAQRFPDIIVLPPVEPPSLLERFSHAADAYENGFAGGLCGMFAFRAAGEALEILIPLYNSDNLVSVEAAVTAVIGLYVTKKAAKAAGAYVGRSIRTSPKATIAGGAIGLTFLNQGYHMIKPTLDQIL